MARRVGSNEAGPSSGYYYYTDSQRAQFNHPNIFDSDDYVNLTEI